jgi:hypothetical protein
VSVFYGFFVADAGEAEALDYDTYAFVVEVRHDDCYISISFQFLSDGKGRVTYL